MGKVAYWVEMLRPNCKISSLNTAKYSAISFINKCFKDIIKKPSMSRGTEVVKQMLLHA